MNEPKLKVLIADDEFYCRALLKEMMASMNCEVIGEAANGLEAVAMYRELNPHLVLMDVNMPLKMGDDALEEIMKEFPKAFVIIISSIADMSHVEKCLAAGASNYIRKDTPIAEIKRIIKESWSTFVRDRGKKGPAGPVRSDAAES